MADQTKIIGLERLSHFKILLDNAILKTLQDYAKTTSIPTKVSQLTNDNGYQNASEVASAISSSITSAITSYALKSELPTKTSDISNDSGFITSADIPTKLSSFSNDKNYQNATEVQELINNTVSSMTSINFEIVSSLPANGVNGTFYLVSNGGTTGNSYDEYVWIASQNKFEKIGTTEVDLSGYVQKSDIIYATDADIESLF